MEYDTIVNGHVAVRPAKTLRYWDDSAKFWTTKQFSAVTWKSPPASSVKHHDPELKVIKHRYDPTKGRSFTKLKKEGVIAVSPLHVVNITSQDFLAGVHHVLKGHGFLQSSGPYFGKDTCFEYMDTSSYLDCHWTEQGDFSHWSSQLPGKHFVSTYIDQQDINDAIATTQQKAMVDALKGYDLLTDLVELEKTLKFILGNVGTIAGLLSKLRKKDPVAWSAGKNMTPKDLLRSSDKGLRELGSRWMEYRYAVMPLIYSIRDIIASSKGDIYWKTSRAKEVLTPKPYVPDQVSMLSQKTYLTDELTGSITVRSFVKQHYNLTGLANLLGARLTFNPFITAWESTKLSFVVDWFWNFGDLITLSTSPSFSDQMVLVTSIRDQTVKTTYLVDLSSDVTVSSWNVTTPCVSPASFTETFTRNDKLPLRTTIVNSYNRFLPSEADSRVVFDINLNWKRIIDSLVLLYQPTKSILRSLK